MSTANPSWRKQANQPAPAPARPTESVEKVTARASHRVMTDMESRYSREEGRLPSRLLPCEFFDNSITAIVRQLLAQGRQKNLTRLKDIEIHFFFNPPTHAAPNPELEVPTCNLALTHPP